MIISKGNSSYLYQNIIKHFVRKYFYRVIIRNINIFVLNFHFNTKLKTIFENEKSNLFFLISYYFLKYNMKIGSISLYIIILKAFPILFIEILLITLLGNIFIE